MRVEKNYGGGDNYLCYRLSSRIKIEQFSFNDRYSIQYLHIFLNKSQEIQYYYYEKNEQFQLIDRVDGESEKDNQNDIVLCNKTDDTDKFFLLKTFFIF